MSIDYFVGDSESDGEVAWSVCCSQITAAAIHVILYDTYICTLYIYAYLSLFLFLCSCSLLYYCYVFTY
jgi:hypothetical protein